MRVFTDYCSESIQFAAYLQPMFRRRAADR